MGCCCESKATVETKNQFEVRSDKNLDVDAPNAQNQTTQDFYSPRIEESKDLVGTLGG